MYRALLDYERIRRALLVLVVALAGLAMQGVGVNYALAVATQADSVSENFTPALTLNFACWNDVAAVSDNVISNANGYCPQAGTASNYTITLNFSPTPGQYMDRIFVWANAGNAYNDGELREFDLTVNYLLKDGTPAVLTMNDVNIGDTVSAADVKTVILNDGSGPVQLHGVSTVSISDIKGLPGVAAEIAMREIQGNFVTPPVDLVTIKSLRSPSMANVGDLVRFQIRVINWGTATAFNIALNDLIPAGLTPAGNHGLVSRGTYNSATGSWSIPFLETNRSATLDIEGTVNAGQAGNTITNTTTAADNAQNDSVNTIGDVLSQSVVISNPSLSITKTASQTTNVSLGMTLTYTYEISNTGNVPISGISLIDIHQGFGTPPVPNNEVLHNDVSPAGDSSDAAINGIWDLLGPGDTIRLTAQYVVTQQDIDQLQ